MKQPHLFENFSEKQIVILKCQFAIIATRFTTVVSKAILPVHIGNAGNSTSLPITLFTIASTLVSACLIAPIWEEFIFRALPILAIEVINKKCNISKYFVFFVNVLSSVIFAYGHNFVLNVSNPLDSTFIPGWLPIPQFVYGMFLFHIAYVHGVIYSMISHSYVNFLIILAVFLKLIF